MDNVVERVDGANVDEGFAFHKTNGWMEIASETNTCVAM